MWCTLSVLIPFVGASTMSMSSCFSSQSWKQCPLTKHTSELYATSNTNFEEHPSCGHLKALWKDQRMNKMNLDYFLPVMSCFSPHTIIAHPLIMLLCFNPYRHTIITHHNEEPTHKLELYAHTQDMASLPVQSLIWALDWLCHLYPKGKSRFANANGCSSCMSFIWKSSIKEDILHSGKYFASSP